MSTGTCPDCFSGTISISTPTGTVTTIHGLPTYVTAPEDGVKPKGLIVFIADAFGYTLPNNQALADQYAKKGGFLVYVPDFMGGKLPVLTHERGSSSRCYPQAMQWMLPPCNSWKRSSSPPRG